MPEYEQFLETIKLAVADVVDAGRPFALTYGTVKTVSPLTITVDQKLELDSAQLLLTNAVREYEVDTTVTHWTEDEMEHTHAIHDIYTGGRASDPTAHKHAYAGRKKFTVHLGLKTGETVLLLRIQGGQRYIVLDRVEAPS